MTILGVESEAIEALSRIHGEVSDAILALQEARDLRYALTKLRNENEALRDAALRRETELREVATNKSARDLLNMRSELARVHLDLAEMRKKHDLADTNARALYALAMEAGADVELFREEYGF